MSTSAPETIVRTTWQPTLGASVKDAATTFSVWAPRARTVSAHVRTGDSAGDHALRRASDHRGVWTATIDGVTHSDRYGFRLDGGEPLPDPTSRSQPDGVHGLSEVIDPSRFEWTDDEWKGLALADFVIYELHVGTFTPEGTFDAIIPRLPELAELGITAIEVMPIASFPGRRNWGYDGVHFYAPQHSYGGPDGFKRLVDAAHANGLAVVLDVVYNHVGPEGNYLGNFGPYFTDTYHTAWGHGVNYDGAGSDGVRRWAHENALYWLAEFHVDALRLDAVHGIFDFGALSFLEELSDAVHGLGRTLGRKMQLMAESDLNDARIVRPPEQGGFGVDSQWADDFHHTLHATLTGERHGYYVDYHGIATMADVYREPFFYARRYSASRDRVHGRSSKGVPRQRFIVCAQNHDQVGNRGQADRLSSLVAPAGLRLAAALVLLSPYIPLLFMGEEYGDTAPFFYFIEHGDPKLVESVRAGRKREFAFLAAMGIDVDPQAEETFARSRIEWSQRDSGEGARLRSLYHDLLALRRELPALRPGVVVAVVDGGPEWLTVVRDNVLCAFNLSEATRDLRLPVEAGGAWRLRLSTEAAAYGGSGEASADIASGSIRLAARSAAVLVRGSEEPGHSTAC